MTGRVLKLLAVAFAAVAAGVATSSDHDIARARAPEAAVNSPGARSPGCPSARLSSRYVKRVDTRFARGATLGAHLLAAPNGPTYERAQRYLTPLLLARTKNGRKLTRSGVHYTHFSQPPPTGGATSGRSARRRREPDHLAGALTGGTCRSASGCAVASCTGPASGGSTHRPWPCVISRSSRRNTSIATASGTGRSRSPSGSRRRPRSSASSSSRPTRAARGSGSFEFA